MDDAISAYQARRLRHAELSSRVRRGEEEPQFAQACHKHGLTIDLPRLEAQSALLRWQREQAQCQSDLATAWVALHKALGDDGSARSGTEY